jgi:hypothetical protein
MQPKALLILKAWVVKTPAFFIGYGRYEWKGKN